MDFTLSQEQQEIRSYVRDALSRTAEPLGEEKALQQLVSLDLLTVGLPEDLGGSGGGVFETTLIAIEAGRAADPSRYDCVTPTVATAAAIFGSPEQRERIVPAIVSAELRVAIAGQPARLDTPAAPHGGLSLTGQLRHVSTAEPRASVLVPVEVDGRSHLALVPLDDPGVRLTPVRTTDRGAESHVELNGVVVEATNVLSCGDVDGATWLWERAVAAAGAFQLGVCSAALDLVAAHIAERQQFGRRLSDFQAVTQRFADAHIALSRMEVSTWRLVSLLAHEQFTGAAAHLAKYESATSARRIIGAAVHLHGGVGVDITYPLTPLILLSKRYELWLGGAGSALDTLADVMAKTEDLDALLLD